MQPARDQDCHYEKDDVLKHEELRGSRTAATPNKSPDMISEFSSHGESNSRCPFALIENVDERRTFQFLG